ncbi:MAG TPA: hypothetical protein VK522_00265 [Pseudolabrys sp.]|jgi:hypothetical protein|nr:hypothetical protein [Pseudolabrys sp.]
MQYQLNISIDHIGLTNIYAAGQAITVVKSVVSNPVASGNLPVAWINFQPLEENTVSWIENYNIYATTTQLNSGATIVQTSVTGTPVQTGWTYSFAQGQFTGAQGGSNLTYNMLNNQGGMYNFGLSQQAVVNNVAVMAPLSAIPVMTNESASFTPEETVSIFLSNSVNNGVVLSQVASNALVVELSSQNASANIGFNDSNNTFYLSTSAQLTSGDFARRLRSSVA